MEIRKLRRYPLFSESIDYVLNKFPLYKKTYTYIMNNFDEDYFMFANEICELLLLKKGSKYEYIKAFDSFIKFSLEYLKLQFELIKTGKYHYQIFSEVNRRIYQHVMMDSYYLDGLLLSQVFWPNHYRIIEFFKDFCDLLKDKHRGMEVPCGTGIFSRILLNKFQDKKLDLVDISPYSVDYTKKLLYLSKLNIDWVNIETRDLFNLTGENKYDFIICGELIEHLEKPKEALDILNRLLRTNGIIFLTTAIYSADIDHIYLFHDVNEVRELITKSGFLIKSELILPTSLKSYSKEMRNESINYACTMSNR